MTLLAALPAWNTLHPLVVHFPIALLLVAPVFVLLGALWPGRTGLAFLGCALILMSLGTAGTFVAQSTGEAASRATLQTPALTAMIERHEDLAEATGWVFLSLTAIFAAMCYGLVLLSRTRATFHGQVSAYHLRRALHGGGGIAHSNRPSRGTTGTPVWRTCHHAGRDIEHRIPRLRFPSEPEAHSCPARRSAVLIRCQRQGQSSCARPDSRAARRAKIGRGGGHDRGACP